MSASEGTILLAVCRDFLIPGADEPLELAEVGSAAIRAAIDLTCAIGDLDQGLEEALLLAYSLEGQGDSPEAARAIRRAIASSATAMSALEIESDRMELALRERGRRIARRKLTASPRSGPERPDFGSIVRIDPR